MSFHMRRAITAGLFESVDHKASAKDTITKRPVFVSVTVRKSRNRTHSGSCMSVLLYLIPTTRLILPLTRALPPEIRNKIYACLLTAQLPLLLMPLFRPGTYQPVIFQIFSDDDDIWTSRTERPCVNVLRACKSVHAEASAILYHSNKFVFGGADGILQWLRTLSKPSRRNLKSMEVWNYYFVHSNRRNRSWLKKKVKKLAPKANIVISLSRLNLWIAH